LGKKLELYFLSVVLEGIWEGKSKARRGSQEFGEPRNPWVWVLCMPIMCCCFIINF